MPVSTPYCGILAQSDTGVTDHLDFECIDSVEFSNVLINGSSEPITIETGDTALAFTSVNAGGYTWSVIKDSADAVIIDEKTGIITAVTPGTAQVKATSTIDGEKSILSATITVEDTYEHEGHMLNRYKYDSTSGSGYGLLSSTRQVERYYNSTYHSDITYDFASINWDDYVSDIPFISLIMNFMFITSYDISLEYWDAYSHQWVSLVEDSDYFVYPDYDCVVLSEDVVWALKNGLARYGRAIYTYTMSTNFGNFSFEAYISEGQP